MTPEQILALREYARRDLMTFFRRFCWPVIEPNTPLSVNWAMELMCDHLMALGRRELAEYGHSLLITVPPRHSKSSIATIAFPMWLWIKDPTERFLHTSFNVQLATTHAGYRRDLVASRAYQMLRIIDVKKTNTKTFFQNSDQGYSRVVARNKSTGSGATGLLLDDLHSTTDSQAEIEAGVNHYLGGLKSRLNQTNSFKLIVMQRVGQKDVAAKAIEEGYLHLNVAIESAKRRTYIFFSGRTIEVPENTLIDPSRLTDSVDNLKRNPIVWATQYLQTPQVKGGAIFKSRSFAKNSQLYAMDYQNRVLSLDSASSTKDGSANWAFGVWDYNDNRAVIALRHIHAEPMQYYEGKQHLIGLIQQFNPSVVLIENKSTGIALISDLPVELGQDCPHLEPINPKQDKLTRACVAAEALRTRSIVLPEAAEWLDAFMEEISLFPLSAQKDQVDMTSQTILWLHEQGVKEVTEGGGFILD